MRIIIIIFALLLSCSPQKETFVNKTFIPSNELEFKLVVSNADYIKIVRKYARNGYNLASKPQGRNNHIIYFNIEQLEATKKNKGKRSILPKRFDIMIRNAIMDEIN